MENQKTFIFALEHMWFFSSCSILPRLILKRIYFPKAHVGWAAEGHALFYLAGRNRLGLTRLMVSPGLKDSICNKTRLFRWILYSFENIEHDSRRAICHLTLLITLRKKSWRGSYSEKINKSEHFISSFFQEFLLYY